MVRKRYLTRADMTQIIRQAHQICKEKVPVESHKGASGRTRLGRPRDKYLNCLRETIQELVKKRLQELGVKVAS
jgi:hypothetical protein